MDHSNSVTVFLVLLYHLSLLIGCVNGRRALPPLPIKDGCFRVSAELELFRLPGEAVILTWPKLQRTLHVRRLTSTTATYTVSEGRGTGARASTAATHTFSEGRGTAGARASTAETHTFSEARGTGARAYGRVQQHDGQLWLLPAQASDSGEYTCIYRNETYCIAGSITLHVYESSSIDMDKLSYPWSATAGQSVTLACPSLAHFNWTDHMEWFKEPSATALQLRAAGAFRRGGDDHQMTIPEFSHSQQGLYTCRLTALINDQLYNISRTIRLHVQGIDPIMQTSRPTTDLSMTSDPKHPTRGGHSTVENTMFTWIVVVMVGLSCALTVVSVFLYFLLKPKRKTDYSLARQTSVF